MISKGVLVKLIAIFAIMLKFTCRADLDDEDLGHSCFDATNETKLATSKCSQDAEAFTRGVTNVTMELRCKLFVTFYGCLEQVLKDCKDQSAANADRNIYKTHLEEIGCDARNNLNIINATTTVLNANNSTEEAAEICPKDDENEADMELKVNDNTSDKIRSEKNQVAETGNKATRKNGPSSLFLFCSSVALYIALLQNNN